MRHLPLTVIILVHQLDKRLEKTLASIQFADEIILVKTVATLNLEQLKKDFSIKVYTHISPSDTFDFSQVRNQALQQAQHQWVLFLDSDEWILEKSVKEIKDLVTSDKHDLISVNRRDIFLGQQLKYGEVGSSTIVRLGRKELMKYTRPVHELPIKKDNIYYSSIVIQHDSHLSLSHFLQKVTWYSKLEAQYKQRQKHQFSLMSLVLYPLAKFFLNFVFKRGFLDGWRGLCYALLMSLHSFFVRIYLYEQTKSA